MRKAHAAFVIVAAITMGGLQAACDQDGPAERAGEAIDNAAENVGDAARDAGRAIERKTD